MSRPTLVWRQLVLPSVITPDAARCALLSLAALPGQPRLVLEAVATAGAVGWRLGGPESAVRKASRLLAANLPGTLVTAPEASVKLDELTVAGQVRLTHTRHLPLASGDIDHVARSFLSGCAATGRDELLRLQVVLGARRRPHRAPDMQHLSRQAATTKHEQFGLGCCVRLGARSARPERARQLLHDAAASLRGLETSGVRLHLQFRPVRDVTHVRSPLLWPLWLTVAELVPLLGWPIATDAKAELPAAPRRHPRYMPARSLHLRRTDHDRTISPTATTNGTLGRPVVQSTADALQHTHVMGLTGTGKSTLLAQLLLSDAAARQGAVVIDPKGDLVDDLLARLPEDRLDDVVVLDARDPSPVGINPLMGTEPDLAADSVLAVFHSLYASGWGPRTGDLLHGCLLTLARRGDASLVMVPLLLTNPGFRRSVIGPVVRDDPLGLGTFWATFNAWSDAERQHNIQPLLNKLRQILLRPALRGVFGQRRPSFDLRQVFTEQKLLLVALGKGTIGAEAAQLLGSLVVSHLWQLTTQRIATPATERQPVTVMVDELQDYLRLPQDLGDALAQARGLGIGFVLAHQELGQLGQLKPAVMANTRSRIFFQVAPDDANQIATAFGDGVLVREDFRALPAYHAYAQLLADGTTAPWVSLATTPLPPALRQPAEVRRRSAAHYGQPLDEIEADLLGLLDRPRGSTTDPAATQSASGSDLGRRRTTPPHSASQPKGGTE